MKHAIFPSIPKAWSAIEQSGLALPACRSFAMAGNLSKGFSLVEVILASAVFVLLVAALAGAYLYGEEAAMLAGNRTRAVLLAEEGIEAVRNIRDAGFSNLADGVYGLSAAGNQWNLSGSSDTSDIFTRQMIISSVDSKRKSVTANVAWQQNAQRAGSVALATYFTDWIAPAGGGAPPASCAAYCQTLPAGYAGGICRQNTQQCVNNSEIYEAGGDSICAASFPGDSSHDTCCCQP